MNLQQLRYLVTAADAGSFSGAARTLQISQPVLSRALHALERIKERYDMGVSTREAVASGVASTARIITGAALIILVVFVGFAFGKLVMFQQMGFGVAVAC